ncbi:MAG: non-ribosomal peptide synthetase, partial [Gammaproteobacteria bacterium]|nr:non-ribosomal peptide synthetase [Gammaproteobacteria bacterium]
MSLVEFMSEMVSQGVRLRVEDGELAVSAPKGVLTAEMRNRILARRTELLSLLSGVAPAGSNEAAAIPRVADSNAMPLSFAQERLWFVTQLEADSTAMDGNGRSALFNIHIPLYMRGPLDLSVLSACLHEIYRRHDCLRTLFFVRDGVPMQRVECNAPLDLSEADLSMIPVEQRRMALEAFLREQSDTPLDLLNGPVFRCRLIRLADDEIVLLMSVHHIVADGWSVEILFRELTALYRAFRAGRPSPLPRLSIRYGDYAIWQRSRFERNQLHEALNYWRESLDGIGTLLLATDRGRSAVQRFKGALREQILPKQLLVKIKTLGQRVGATPFMTLLAGFMVLLHRHSGQDRIVVGSPVANREHPELAGLIGFFVNNLVLSLQLAGQQSFIAVLANVRKICLGAYAHQEIPFEKLVDELQPQRDLSRNPFFQVVFTHQGPSGGSLQLEDFELCVLPSEVRSTRFDLECHVVESSQGLAVRFVYNTDLFDA